MRIFPAEVNIKFSSNYFQHLTPLEALLPEDVCVPAAARFSPGEKGGCEIVPAGANTSELAKKSLLP